MGKDVFVYVCVDGCVCVCVCVCVCIHSYVFVRMCIFQLPREIGQLVSLQSLDVSHNKQLTTLPDELGRCSRLWEVGSQ